VFVAVVATYDDLCASLFVADAGWFGHEFFLLGILGCAADLAVAVAFGAVFWACFWGYVDCWGCLNGFNGFFYSGVFCHADLFRSMGKSWTCADSNRGAK
jgi:hypothetical protein